MLYFDEVRLVVAGSGGGSASTTVRYVHTDHLTGANTITSQTGQIVETLDYYPYGQIRVNDKTTTYDERRKYAGTEYDSVSGLNYMQARYYDSNTAHFISQDPVFWEVGVTKDGKAVLTNPQALNSYSYAGGNPIVNKDATGRLFGVDDAAVAVIGYSLWAYSVASLGVDLYDAKTTFVDYPEQFSSEEKSQVAGKLILDGVLGAAARVARGVEQITINVGTTFLDIMDYYFADQLYKDMNDKKKNEPSDDKGQKTSSSQRTSNSQANSTKTGSYLTNASGSRVNGTNGGGSNQTFSSTYSQFTNGLRSFTASLSSFVAGLSSAGGKNTSNKK